MIQQWLETLRSGWMQHWMSWAIFAGYLAATWVAAWLAKVLVRKVIAPLSARSRTALDDRLVTAAGGPVRFVVMALGVQAGLTSLGSRIPSFANPALLGHEFSWIQRIMGALVILAVTHLVNGLLKAGLNWYLHDMAVKNNSHWDEELLPVIRRVLSMVLYFIAASIILKNFGLDITALVTTAGVASLAVALAAQETLSNMLGGFVILVDRPFRVGDVIELADGKVGEVLEIGLRSTRIKQFDGNALVVPNKDMANSRITNYALPNPSAAIRVTVGVHYSTDIDRAKQILLEQISAHPEVLKDPAPGVWFTKMNESTLDLFFSCWVPSYKDRFRITDELNTRILQAFREAGIQIAYPQREVHVHMKP